MDTNGPEDSLNHSNSAGVWFVYGSLKPAELGFRQIEHLIDHHEPAQLKGYRLLVRDGLPAIGNDKSETKTVDGHLLYAKVGEESELASVIEAFEKPDNYYVQDVEVINDSGISVQAAANFLKYPKNGNPEFIESSSWSVCDDAYFRYGLPTLFCMARKPIDDFHGPGDSPDFWKAYLPIMGTFLNLWTVLERYVAFAQPGTKRSLSEKNRPGKPPTMKKHLLALGRSEEGKQAAVSIVHLPSRRVYGTDNVSTPARLHIPLETWYQVRNNSAHRGKAAFGDYALVRSSALGLSEFLVALLSQEVNGLEHLKELLDVNEMDKQKLISIKPCII